MKRTIKNNCKKEFERNIKEDKALFLFCLLYRDEFNIFPIALYVQREIANMFKDKLLKLDSLNKQMKYKNLDSPPKTNFELICILFSLTNKILKKDKESIRFKELKECAKAIILIVKIDNIPEEIKNLVLNKIGKRVSRKITWF